MLGLSLLAVAALAGAAAFPIAAVPDGPAAPDGVSAGTTRSFTVTPNRAPRGTLITFTGRGWRAGAKLELLIGPPRSEADRFALTRTDANGAFRRRWRLPADIARKRWVVLACQRGCRDKKSRGLTVTR